MLMTEEPETEKVVTEWKIETIQIEKAGIEIER